MPRKKEKFSALRPQYMSQRKENKNEKIDDGAFDFVEEKDQKGKPIFVMSGVWWT